MAQNPVALLQWRLKILLPRHPGSLSSSPSSAGGHACAAELRWPCRPAAVGNLLSTTAPPVLSMHGDLPAVYFFFWSCCSGLRDAERRQLRRHTPHTCVWRFVVVMFLPFSPSLRSCSCCVYLPGAISHSSLRAKQGWTSCTERLIVGPALCYGESLPGPVILPCPWFPCPALGTWCSVSSSFSCCMMSPMLFLVGLLLQTKY